MKAVSKAMSVDTNTNCRKDWPITTSASCQRLEKQIVYFSSKTFLKKMQSMPSSDD